MRDSQCPKCDELVRPTWHAWCKADKENKQVSQSDKEHLHYFCKCGYDFIHPANQEENL